MLRTRSAAALISVSLLEARIHGSSLAVQSMITSSTVITALKGKEVSPALRISDGCRLDGTLTMPIRRTRRIGITYSMPFATSMKERRLRSTTGCYKTISTIVMPVTDKPSRRISQHSGSLNSPTLLNTRH